MSRFVLSEDGSLSFDRYSTDRTEYWLLKQFAPQQPFNTLYKFIFTNILCLYTVMSLDSIHVEVVYYSK